MSIVKLDDFRRTARPDEGTGLATCDCGSQWFELRRRPGDPEDVDGGVALDEIGAIVAYAGVPCCLSCGQPWAPPT